MNTAVLHRPPSPAAIRSRAYRARRKAGVVGVLHVQATRRLVAALQAANSSADLASREAIEAELASVVEGFMVRWLGPQKDRTRDAPRRR